MARTWGLNFFLLEAAVQSAKDALQATAGLHKREIRDNAGFTGILYYKLGEEHPPDWTLLVQPNLKSRAEFPDTQSTSAVLFVRTQNGFYAYTFGVGGRSLLRPDAYVPEFGKKTVLSIADPNKLRSIDLRAMRDQPFLTRQQPSRGTRLSAFGIDTLQDHLRAVTGIPYGQYEGLAKQVAGADALAYRASLDFTDLGAKSDGFLAAFNTAAYKQIHDFAWVDQISIVRAKARIDILDNLMLDRVRQRNFEFGPPVLIDWERGPAFAYEPDAAVQQRFEFVTVENLAEALGGDLTVVTLDQLKELKVHLFYDDAPKAELSWRVYGCIEVDIVDQGEQFTFGGGRWSLIERDFHDNVDRYVDELKAGPPPLPPATLADDGNPTRTNIIEGLYIDRVAANKPLEMARVHQCGVDIRVGGDIVELCDIYDVSKDLIHLKIWRSSQGFSALAMQAATAAELLVSDKTFLRDARRLLEGRGNQFRGILQDDFNPRDYRIVIGLIRKEAGEIPFFSRLTLMRAAERVTGKALRVVFVVIPVQ
jgi:uncharacterized protein (TIGR04141 family)